MSNHISLLQDLKAGKACTIEAAAAIESLEAENAVLKNALREIESVSVYGQDLNEAIALAGRVLRPPQQEGEQ